MNAAQRIQFSYQYNKGDTWASGAIELDDRRFEFLCSCLFNNPLEVLLYSIYQLIPNLAPVPRKEIHFTLYDEPLEYSWYFKMLDNETVGILIYSNGQNSVFEGRCNLIHLVKTFVQSLPDQVVLTMDEKVRSIYEELRHFIKRLSSHV
ncbi:hypothetical protein D3H55_13935 [Bacillus salacetis]|uniref:Uncharacterized protein n=1 Tax=Bacillus salacetis TaxID=2315464 RepID=A0A3A1QUY3_9BACI|nr:hypothetical protein [Bacillus salacetis]RIW31980.1 hypothetical protein D3H55_13935 [Bacillus salacetis]